MKQFLMLFALLFAVPAFAVDEQKMTIADAAATETIITLGADSYTYNPVRAPDNCLLTMTNSEMLSFAAAMDVAVEQKSDVQMLTIKDQDATITITTVSANVIEVNAVRAPDNCPLTHTAIEAKALSANLRSAIEQ